MQTSFTELTKALSSLAEALQLYDSASVQDEVIKKAFRDACIQRFEYSLEFSWKTAMKVLGSTTAAAKPAVREMARNNLIVNPEAWLEFIEARNHSSHSYDEEVAQKVFKSIKAFYPEAIQLVEKLKRQK